MLVDFERSDKQIGAGSMLLQACPRAAEQKGSIDDTLHFDGACRHLKILWTAPYLIFAVQASKEILALKIHVN